MKYYKLMYDYENDENYVNCSLCSKMEIDEYSVSCGTICNEWGEMEFKYNSDEGEVFSDYIANVFRWLIVSKRFRELIQDIVRDDAIQYLSTKITDVISKNETTEYEIANLLDVVDGVDLEHSKYDVFELDDEKIISVEKYALKKEKIDGHNIFRLKNDTLPVFVSERIKKVIEDNTLTGFAFLEVETY